MDKLAYDTLIRDLRSGRELEFKWEGLWLAISRNAPHAWYFTNMERQISVEAESLDDLVSRITFGKSGKHLRDILPEIEDYTLF